jgi:hypothetical protein
VPGEFTEIFLKVFSVRKVSVLSVVKLFGKPTQLDTPYFRPIFRESNQAKRSTFIEPFAALLFLSNHRRTLRAGREQD